MNDAGRKDIFISYKNDDSGDQFAIRLSKDLEALGYSVYCNENEERAHSFPERLREAVRNCKDFVLILSAGCMAQLKRYEEIDWVREELLTAQAAEKHIIPVLMDGVDLPKNAKEMPEPLQFLPNIDAIRLPKHYLESPFSVLLGALHSKRDGQERFRNSFNSSPWYDINKDFEAILQKAHSGNVEAMYEAGMMYYYGVTTAQGNTSEWDFENAAYWLKKVSESESELRYHAMNIIARMYYQGLMPGEPQSYEKAYQYHEMAAVKDAHSAATKASMMSNGTGCAFDYEKILAYYRGEIEKGDDLYVLGLAKFYIKYGCYAEAVSLCESITYVSPEVDYQLGMLYKNGAMTNPPQPDHYRAAYYLRNAAENNHVQAAFEYGMLCFRPVGNFRKNFKDAEKYLKIAADGGLAEAQYVLASMYKNGLTTRDYARAIEYLEMAKRQNHTYASLDLAMLYQQPECQNYQRAFECAELAASHGLSQAELILGNLLFWGRGCEADLNKADEMYTRAYKHGMYYAKIMKEKVEKIKTEMRETDSVCLSIGG